MKYSFYRFFTFCIMEYYHTNNFVHWSCIVNILRAVSDGIPYPLDSVAGSMYHFIVLERYSPLESVILNLTVQSLPHIAKQLQTFIVYRPLVKIYLKSNIWTALWNFLIVVLNFKFIYLETLRNTYKGLLKWYVQY